MGPVTFGDSQLVQTRRDTVVDTLESARTILHCSVHLKRVVDDILICSKLESDLLHVAPDRVKLQGCVADTISMFQAELKSSAIELTYEIDNSIEALQIDQVYLDPSRLAQVIINCLTNAIKFTRDEARRFIQVRLAASIDRPDSSMLGVKIIPRKHVESSAFMSGADWGMGQDVFVHVAISDTGKGLTPSELESLFQRFRQASHRTHVRYGGSGLGLYIAREL